MKNKINESFFNLTFENYWGEHLIQVGIDMDPDPNPYHPSKTYFQDNGNISIRHIDNKQHITLKEQFYYSLEDTHYWRIFFITKYGQTWISEYGFSCQIKPEDNHTVIIGVNGDSKRMYVSFPNSSSCSTALSKAQ
ncbi:MULTISPECIES: hypothetical protein [unclassified Providencia]|uniref:hypothetical protein n=1 Tax=unclassified Providencia TaxID=2633465 RepID=UPI00234BC1A7|nr:MULTISPECIES: hypothetical protein [unclassified Providencia]